MRLEPLEVWFQPGGGSLLEALRTYLNTAGRLQAGAQASLLRWAITAVDPGRGLRIEAMLVVDGPSPLRLRPQARPSLERC